MAIKSLKEMVRLSALVVSLELVACGGGDGSWCLTMSGSCQAPNVNGTGSNSANNSSTTLFSTAPAAITLTAGSSATYTIGGGMPPYTAASSNINVGRVSIFGETLTLSGVAAGTSRIAIADSAGETTNLGLTVLAQSQAGTALSIAPDAFTVSDCTTNIPFFFNGGVAPYTLFTSDKAHAPVSAAQSSGGRPYFTATVQFNGAMPSTNAFDVTLTVSDSQSRTATATLAVVGSHTCANNLILQAQPAFANIRVTENLSLQITGGSPSATEHNISFIDSGSSISAPTSAFVQVVPGTNTANSISIQGTKSASTMMIVGDPKDGQNAIINITVL